MRCILVLRQNSIPAISLLCLPTLRQKLVGKVVLFIFRQNLHVLPELDVLETGDVPILFSLRDMVLVKCVLSDVIVALHLCSRIFRRIKLNFLFSLGYNALCIPLAARVFFCWQENRWRLGCVGVPWRCRRYQWSLHRYCCNAMRRQSCRLWVVVFAWDAVGMHCNRISPCAVGSSWTKGKPTF